MQLYDKFNIIENHLQDTTEPAIFSKIDNYFENILKTDNNILIANYIRLMTWFNKNKIDKYIAIFELHLKNYLIQIRNTMRISIKRDVFELLTLNNFINKFKSKVEYITINFNNNIFIQIGITELANLIISDSIIMQFTEEHMVQFDNDTRNIKVFFNTLNNLNKYDIGGMYNKTLVILSNRLKLDLINQPNYPLPENIKQIQLFNDSLIYYEKIIKYYDFIKTDIINISKGMVDIIVDNFCKLIKANNIDNLIFIFDNYWEKITNIIKLYNISINEHLQYTIDTLARTANIDIIKLLKIWYYADNFIKGICIGKIALNKLFTDDNIVILLTKVDNIIKNNNNDNVDYLFAFISKVVNCDVYINKYYELLIKRLMVNFSLPKNEFVRYIEIENNMKYKLKKVFNIKLLYKINKVIQDTTSSYNDMINFKNTNLSVITTSYNNWDINQNDGLLNKKNLLDIQSTYSGIQLYEYQLYYENIYKNRTLNWFPHFGEVIITYLDQKLKMLPIQFMVLELFNDIDNISIDKILSASFLVNYSVKFRNDIVYSLITANLLNNNNNNITLATNGIFKYDLIDVFMNMSDYANIMILKRQEALIHSRQEIINANINSTLKYCSVSKNDLYEIIKHNIKVFTLTDELLNSSLKYLIDMDYIQLNNMIYEKIIY